jgi:hypothetical protein
MAIHLPLPPEGEPGSQKPPSELGWILVMLGVVVVTLAIGGGVL